VVALGPGSQDEDDSLNYIAMPQGMSTYRPPVLPEPEDMAGHADALAALTQVLARLQAHVRGEAVEPVRLDGLAAADLALIHQVLGEGEVSAQVLPDADGHSAWRQVQIQESVFAGLWRVVGVDADGAVHDTLQAGACPQVLREVAREDARGTRPDLSGTPAGVMNALPLLVELEDQRQRWTPGQLAHVVNLTLLPLSPDDIGLIDHVLGTGRVLILSRGYGNCRITSTRVSNTWRVVYYNSADSVILNSIEVTDLPEVACAATEDLRDSHERLTEVLEWVHQA
jgi:hydrogenase-1 operon protein HyaF